MRIASKGHAVFAATLIGLGLLGLIQGDFTAVWGGVPKALPARELLAYLCAGVSLACGLGLLWPRTAASSARVVLAYLVVWTLLFKGRFILLEPTSEGPYQTFGENLVLVAGAWVLYAWLATEWDRQHLGFAVADRGVRIARVLYSLAMIAFGLSHFAYLNLTVPLVPGWLPWHVGWAYFTGMAYLAAALAMLTGVCARLAAVLSVAQMGGFTLLVWVPMAIAGTLSTFQWGELLESWALTAAAWVVADSYRGMPWLALSRRPVIVSSGGTRAAS
ncbi:MAG TPA: hypothetical protein VFO44_14510 [Steroidobacteraceae bacterium]|nr:hypothetical protein [Steroidobacteraceae bacterium]